MLAAEEVMQPNGVSSILTMARLQDRIEAYPPDNFDREFSFDEVGRMMQALEEKFGPRSGRRLARRIGRACFRLAVQDMRPVLGTADFFLRVLPLRMRLKVGLEILARIFNRFSDHLVRLKEDEQHFQWVFERCGVCWGRDCDAPCCHLAVGSLEELFYWISGGESFYVEEVSCIAGGDETCTILIGKRPLD